MFDISNFIWVWIASFLSPGSLKEDHTQTTKPPGDRTEPLCGDCSPHLLIAAVSVVLFLASNTYWARLNNNRTWANVQQGRIRAAFSPQTSPKTLPGPFKARPSPIRNPAQGEPFDGPALGDADDERTPTRENTRTASPGRSPTPGSSRTASPGQSPTAQSTPGTPGLDTWGRDSSTDQSSPGGPRTPSPLHGKGKQGASSRSGGRARKVEHAPHDWVRQDECGRIHGTPEDRGITCRFSHAEREILVDQRDEDWEERLESRAARIERSRSRRCG